LLEAVGEEAAGEGLLVIAITIVGAAGGSVDAWKFEAVMDCGCAVVCSNI
jgi:hypothetical protein